jgi:hypothetical protein
MKTPLASYIMPDCTENMNTVVISKGVISHVVNKSNAAGAA